MFENEICANCGADLHGPLIPPEHRHMYGGKIYYSRLIGVEYSYDHPDRYDGISEWTCPDCHIRVGRWSGKILQEGESERRWGLG